MLLCILLFVRTQWEPYKERLGVAGALKPLLTREYHQKTSHDLLPRHQTDLHTETSQLNESPTLFITSSLFRTPSLALH